MERLDVDAGDDKSARLHRARRGVDQIAFGRMDEHLQAGPALRQCRDLGDVVEVVVCEENVRRAEVEAIGRLEERLERPAGVDKNGSPPSCAATR